MAIAARDRCRLANLALGRADRVAVFILCALSACQGISCLLFGLVFSHVGIGFHQRFCKRNYFCFCGLAISARVWDNTSAANWLAVFVQSARPEAALFFASCTGANRFVCRRVELAIFSRARFVTEFRNGRLFAEWFARVGVDGACQRGGKVAGTKLSLLFGSRLAPEVEARVLLRIWVRRLAGGGAGRRVVVTLRVLVALLREAWVLHLFTRWQSGIRVHLARTIAASSQAHCFIADAKGRGRILCPSPGSRARAITPALAFRVDAVRVLERARGAALARRVDANRIFLGACDAVRLAKAVLPSARIAAPAAAFWRLVRDGKSACLAVALAHAGEREAGRSVPAASRAADALGWLAVGFGFVFVDVGAFRALRAP